MDQKFVESSIRKRSSVSYWELFSLPLKRVNIQRLETGTAQNQRSQGRTVPIPAAERGVSARAPAGGGSRAFPPGAALEQCC